MTIQEYGSIGELIGAIATVATLLYLAFQIRQNTELLRTSVAQAHREGNVEVQRVMSADESAARVFRVGLSEPSVLTDAERYQFDAQLGLVFSFWEQAQAHDTLLDEQVRWQMRQPGARLFWREFRDVYSKPLAARIDRVLIEEAAAQQGAAADLA